MAGSAACLVCYAPESAAKKKRCTIQRRHHEPFIPETLLREFKVLDAKLDHYSQVQKLPPDKTEARSAINDAIQRCIAAIRQGYRKL